MRKRLAMTLHGLGILAVLLACKSGEPSKEEQAKEQQKALASAISISAVDLHAAYHANEVAADERYKGKVLLIAGRISSINKDAFDNMVISLDTKQMLQEIHATMKDEAKASVASLAKGQVVGLQCIGAGMVLGSPAVNDCTVLLDKPAASAKPAAPAKK